MVVGFEDPCHAQGMRSHSGIFELEPSLPRKKSRIDGDSAAESQLLSSDSDSESELSDFQMQPHPSSRLLVSRRLSQQRQHALSIIDYGQLSESMNEDSEEVDVEYIDPTYYSRAQVGRKKAANRSRGQNMDMLDGKKVEQKRNIPSLFQPQSPLISENMKVSPYSSPYSSDTWYCWPTICWAYSSIGHIHYVCQPCHVDTNCRPFGLEWV